MVIVGLGNPGQTYQHTRHNAGFMVIQWLAERHDVELQQRIVNPLDGRPSAVAGTYEDGAQRVQLLMPLTMMNESGDALRAIGADTQQLLIVCDDVNLPLGALRLRPEGGAGGHHGLASCLEALGTEQVARLRLGVGGGERLDDLTAYVLSPFHSTERPLMREMIAQAAEACEIWVREGLEAAMNRHNRTPEA